MVQPQTFVEKSSNSDHPHDILEPNKRVVPAFIKPPKGRPYGNWTASVFKTRKQLNSWSGIIEQAFIECCCILTRYLFIMRLIGVALVGILQLGDIQFGTFAKMRAVLVARLLNL
jgi:hypothetical protein